jgi:4'-phosphopantetheinyl transferase
MSSETAFADVWILGLDRLRTVDIARCDRVLSPAERDRAQRFTFPQDRNAFRAAHALARIALSSREASMPPDAWVFEETLHGRPEISAASGAPRLRFNISHTPGVVACIVTHGLDCGVDVEQTPFDFDLHDTARTVLAPAELARFAAAPDTERSMLFCRYWTLKEAYAKALGLGMSLSFDKIAFELHEGVARLHAHSDEWHFEHWSPTSTHTVAVAIRSREPVPLIRHYALPDNAPTFPFRGFDPV